jgi:4-hydroxyphenylpyruvate dioxygenase
MELNIPSIRGIGDSLIYLVDRYGVSSIYDVDFLPVETTEDRDSPGLQLIDHLTQDTLR